jgi:hypothetical protein
MVKENVPASPDTSPPSSVDVDIARVLGDTFGETDPDRIRRRRLCKLLEICRDHLRRAARVISVRGLREACRAQLVGAADCFDAALPSMEIAIGVSVADRHRARLSATLARVCGGREVESEGLGGGRVVSGVVPFHDGGETFPLWSVFLDQHGPTILSQLESAAAGLERLMKDVWPEADAPAEIAPRAELPLEGYSTKDVARLLRRAGLHDLDFSALKQRMYRARKALPEQPKNGLTRALLRAQMETGKYEPSKVQEICTMMRKVIECRAAQFDKVLPAAEIERLIAQEAGW